MNMVSLLGLGLVLSYNVAGIRPDTESGDPARWGINLPTNATVGLIVAAVAMLLVLWAVWNSKRETAEMRDAVGSIK